MPVTWGQALDEVTESLLVGEALTHNLVCVPFLCQGARTSRLWLSDGSSLDGVKKQNKTKLLPPLIHVMRLLNL